LTEAAVLVRLHAKPDHIVALRGHTPAPVRTARAVPGCRSIQLPQKPGHPVQTVLLETWADMGYCLSDARRQSAQLLAYFEAARSELADVGVEMRAPIAELPEAVVQDVAA
jgi:quinol monooxygenase YgiN